MTTVAHAQLTSNHRPRGAVIRADEAVRWHDADAHLEEARRRSAEILSSAQEAYDNERRRGFEDGRRAGTEEAIRLITETKLKAETFVADIEAELGDLVVEILREILSPFDAADLVARAVIKALETLRSHAQLTIRTAPGDAAELRARLESLPGPWDHAVMQVDPDPHLDRGRCLLVSEFGQVDVSIETQLQLIALGLRNSRHAKRA
ncbi:type III secretion system stator protein SctL [Bradyrhizobium oligotrophicum]|uniref:type III secretion system stator protein SctL n=1 Tax=Bradyrhizobium oligotrophicum TaxID=44255 RepID=UPI003EBE75B8